MKVKVIRFMMLTTSVFYFYAHFCPSLAEHVCGHVSGHCLHLLAQIRYDPSSAVKDIYNIVKKKTVIFGYFDLLFYTNNV